MFDYKWELNDNIPLDSCGMATPDWVKLKKFPGQTFLLKTEKGQHQRLSYGV